MKRKPLNAFQVILLCLPGCLYAQSGSGIIDPSRVVDWSNAGVTGGIPERSTICSTLNPGVTADQINSAIASCPGGQVVKLNAGTYNISTSIQPKANVTLRGAGMGATILKGTSGFSGDGLITYGNIGDWYLTGQTSYNLTNSQKNDTTITTSSNHNWNVGDYIQIDQLEDLTGSTIIQLAGTAGQTSTSSSCRNPSAACRLTGQTVKIVSIPAANQAVIDTPLYWSYNKTPQATRITDVLTGMGFEDFTLDNSLAASGKIFHFSAAFQSWVLRVEMTNVVTYGLFMYGGAHNTVRGCKLHEGYSGTGGGYSFMLWNRASANVFEDNIIYNLGIMFLMDGSITGNVFAYNYGTSMIYGGSAAGTGIGTHGAHPMMNLFEGNQMNTRFRMDFTWGSNSHNTLFRNRVWNETNPTYTGIRNLIDLWAYSRYNNIIGNVLGTVGQETIYEEATGPVNSSAKVIYAFGETSSFGDRGVDPGVKSTVYRQGNWDSVNNTVKWNEDIVNANRTLPLSLYLRSKPSYFGNCAWPPIGSDLSPMTTDIPAKRRYDGASCATSTLPAPPTNVSALVN